MSNPEIATLRAAIADREPLTELADIRKSMDARLGSKVPDDVTVTACDAGGVPAEWTITPGVDAACVMLYLHGGGYVLGSLDSHRAFVAVAGRATGCRTLALHYRLAPEHKFPAAYDDAIAAMRYAFEHPDQIGIDPTQIAVGGDSAGGNLAAAAALAARDAGLVLTNQVLIYPVTDLNMGTESYLRVTEGFPLVARTMAWFIEHYLGSETDKTDWRASPLHAASLAGTAPAIVVIAAHDPLCDEGLAYAKRLENEGVLVDSIYFSGQLHGFISMGKLLRASDTAIRTIAHSLRANWS